MTLAPGSGRGPAAVVFDLDGVLIDSLEANVEAFSFALARVGLPRPEPARIAALIGRSAGEMLQALGVPGEACPEVLREHLLPRYLEVLPVLARPMPGAAATLARLAGAGCRLAACTSGVLAVQRPVLEQTGLLPLLGWIQTPCQSRFRKPDPRFLQELLDRLPAPAGPVVHVEDLEEGVAMGRAVGAVTVFADYGYGALTVERPDFRIGALPELAPIALGLQVG